MKIERIINIKKKKKKKGKHPWTTQLSRLITRIKKIVRKNMVITLNSFTGIEMLKKIIN